MTNVDGSTTRGVPARLGACIRHELDAGVSRPGSRVLWRLEQGGYRGARLYYPVAALRSTGRPAQIRYTPSEYTAKFLFEQFLAGGMAPGALAERRLPRFDPHRDAVSWPEIQHVEAIQPARATAIEALNTPTRSATVTCAVCGQLALERAERIRPVVDPATDRDLGWAQRIAVFRHHDTEHVLPVACVFPAAR